ncbi:VCBS repeat-containing protein [Desulfoluna sp.]|uniref:FG-GAP repeat domain-containing protein n=1 Tax=Desulfoluna sp. TaxID=2045199 RepID=UPI0026021A80|nr:VCBS repeat-containing protein [Desulfoluna sp.]
MNVSIKKRVVGLMTTMVFLFAGVAMGAQPCLSIHEVSYNGPESSRYLKTGVSQMVENHLGEAGVSVQDTCEGGALAISVTLFGGTANLGASIEKTGYHFSRSGTEAELIGFVQELASEVAGNITGTVPPSSVPASDKKAIRPTAPVPVPSVEAYRSDVFPLQIQSVAMGDLDGDGVMEAVAASQGTLQLLSVSPDAIAETARVSLPHYLKPVRLDLLDFDGDGKPEVILSTLHAASQAPLSLVYRHDGTTLVQVGKAAPFMTAVVNLPEGHGRGCIAQRLQGIDFWGDIYQVTLEAQGLALGQPLDMGDDFTLLGWGRAPVQKSEEQGLYRLSEEGRLGFWNDTKTSVYRSDENFGGSQIFLSKTEGSNEQEERRYLVSRVQAVETDLIKGVGVSQNKDALGHLFQGMRRYKDGRVVVMGWNGYELAPLATTPSFKGFISDFSVVDRNGDGELEAFFSVVNKKGGLSGKARSYFVLSPLK